MIKTKNKKGETACYSIWVFSFINENQLAVKYMDATEWKFIVRHIGSRQKAKNVNSVKSILLNYYYFLIPSCLLKVYESVTDDLALLSDSSKYPILII